jgi:hypothetical protein
VDDFWPELAGLGLEDPESDEDEDFVDAGFDSEAEEPESEPPLAGTVAVEPDRLSVR